MSVLYNELHDLTDPLAVMHLHLEAEIYKRVDFAAFFMDEAERAAAIELRQIYPAEHLSVERPLLHIAHHIVYIAAVGGGTFSYHRKLPSRKKSLRILYHFFHAKKQCLFTALLIFSLSAFRRGVPAVCACRCKADCPRVLSHLRATHSDQSHTRSPC